MTGSFYAHTKGENPTDWERLDVHLREVAELAEQFAAAFSSAEWGRLAGFWHDLGKYHPRFQERLVDDTIRQSHAGAGAALAMERDQRVGLYLAFVIAGHHAGLANLKTSHPGSPNYLLERISEAKRRELAESLPNVPQEIAGQQLPSLPAWITANPTRKEDVCFRLELWTRFLFSALVDADRLATERFCDPEKASRRAPSMDGIPQLRECLEAHLAELRSGLTEEQAQRPINKARAEISQSCLEAAEQPPGLFSLTVPTGGGKTLAAMRFALAHAEMHGLERVIVVIPYTSIIEQNAKQYAGIFGQANVIEHHSNLDPEKRRKDHGNEMIDAQELAAENWDARIVVTTTVQFFESLFSNHPSRSRKLHNISRSVVILDEVQSLSTQFLLTILDGLKQLTTHYGCSIVLSTATPPALKQRESFPDGLREVREIIADPVELSRRLRRVHYEWPDMETEEPLEWEALGRELATHEQVLAVTHRRADARELAEEVCKHVEDETVLHLSALMCPAHRIEVLEEVRERLRKRLPCRLISTQLIEAGVDVDFPVVYRALGGLDSIVQAAGRCNREGRAESGRVVVFRAPSAPPPGTPRRALSTTISMLREEGQIDADDPEKQEAFFRGLYANENLDARMIQRERHQFNFATVARDFKLIEDGFTHPIIVAYDDEGKRRLARLREALAYGKGAAGRDHFRVLQPYTVNVYEQAFKTALNAGALEVICEGLHALGTAHLRHYHKKFGLVIGDEIGWMDPSGLIQ